MSARACSVFAVVLVLAGCEEPGGAPAKPTWVDDVEPILHGNCFHCHGSSADMMGVGTRRWDFAFETGDPKLAAIGDFTFLFGRDVPQDGDPVPLAVSLINDTTGGPQATIMHLFASSAEINMRMPPAPATALSARELKILDNWIKSGRERGVRNPNAKPTAAWLDKDRKLFLVSDADREQVLGKVSCGGKDELLIRTGAHSLATDANPPCTVTLYDGQDTNTVPLN